MRIPLYTHSRSGLLSRPHRTHLPVCRYYADVKETFATLLAQPDVRMPHLSAAMAEALAKRAAAGDAPAQPSAEDRASVERLLHRIFSVDDIIYKKVCKSVLNPSGSLIYGCDQSCCLMLVLDQACRATSPYKGYPWMSHGFSVPDNCSDWINLCQGDCCISPAAATHCWSATAGAGGRAGCLADCACCKACRLPDAGEEPAQQSGR